MAEVIIRGQKWKIVDVVWYIDNYELVNVDTGVKWKWDSGVCFTEEEAEMLENTLDSLVQDKIHEEK